MFSVLYKKKTLDCHYWTVFKDGQEVGEYHIDEWTAGGRMNSDCLKDGDWDIIKDLCDDDLAEQILLGINDD